MRNFRAEEIVSSNLRNILGALAQGESIEESESLLDVENGLERFLPVILADKYPEWEAESLDGFYFVKASKTDENEVEFFGMCILISDQTWTLIHLRLRIAQSDNEIEWLTCRLGEYTQDGLLKKVPYDSSETHRYLHKMETSLITQ